MFRAGCVSLLQMAVGRSFIKWSANGVRLRIIDSSKEGAGLTSDLLADLNPTNDQIASHSQILRLQWADATHLIRLKKMFGFSRKVAGNEKNCQSFSPLLSLLLYFHLGGR